MLFCLLIFFSFCFIVLVFLLLLLLLLLFFFFSFLWDGGMGMEALFRKNTEVFEGKLHIVTSAGQSNWEDFWFGFEERGRGWDAKLQHADVGKSNWWVLELNFAGQIINLKFLLWIIYYLIEFIYISIYSSAFIHLFIHSLINLSLNEFCKFN